MSIQGGATVAVSGLTLAGGSTLANPVGAPFAGGAIANWGNLLMTDCTVTGNSGTDGGGVANYGTLTMIGSTVSHNSTELNSVGGGLFNQGTMTLINSTVANNFALYGGGGLYTSGSGTLTLVDCTVAGNTAEAGPGAGIDNDGTGTVTLDNTIVADSHGSPGGDIAGKVSGSNNLIDDAAASGGLTNGVNGNLVGVDPKLGAWETMAGPPRPWRCSPAAWPSVLASSKASPQISAASRSTRPVPTSALSSTRGRRPPCRSRDRRRVSSRSRRLSLSPRPTPRRQTRMALSRTPSTGTATAATSRRYRGRPRSRSHTVFGTAGSYTPSVIVFDQDHRNSSSAALASPVVVSALDDRHVWQRAHDRVQCDRHGLDRVPGIARRAAHQQHIAIHMDGLEFRQCRGDDAVPLVDTVIDPSSPSAQVTVSGEDRTLGSLFNVDNPFGGTSEQAAATIATAVALAVIGGAAIGTAGGTIATDFASFLTSTPGAGGEPVVGFLPNLIAQTNIFSAGIATGVTAGVISGAFAGGGTTAARSFAVGGSPALIVEQGTVTWSNSLLTTATDAPTIIVKGGKLIPENDWIAGNPFGSQPLIEVNARDVDIGRPGRHRRKRPDDLRLRAVCRRHGDRPGDRRAWEHLQSDHQQSHGPGRRHDHHALVSSSPTALPGQAVTLTATVTAAGSPPATARWNSSTTRPVPSWGPPR